MWKLFVCLKNGLCDAETDALLEFLFSMLDCSMDSRVRKRVSKNFENFVNSTRFFAPCNSPSHNSCVCTGSLEHKMCTKIVSHESTGIPRFLKEWRHSVVVSRIPLMPAAFSVMSVFWLSKILS